MSGVINFVLKLCRSVSECRRSTSQCDDGVDKISGSHVNPSSAGVDFRSQNLKSIPALAKLKYF